MNISCPKARNNLRSCEFKSRRGKVRDVPGVGVQECNECGIVTHTSDLSSYVDYKNGSMHRWSSEQTTLRAKPNSDISRRLEAIISLSFGNPAIRILDWGCGSGNMLNALNYQYNVSGLEPDESLRNSLIEKGFQVWENSAQLVKSGIKYDLVTLFHVVEHFYDAFNELNQIKQVLAKNGRILIETPNANDALLTLYKNEAFENFTYWSHHPMLHSHRSLELLLENSGFFVEKKTGCQRYNLANHLVWLSSGTPGGHELFSNHFSRLTLESYSEDLINAGISDTLWFVARLKY